MLGTLIGLIIIGIVAGFLARLLVPGRDDMSVVQTIVLGIVGSFVGGFLASLIGRGDGSWLSTSGIIGSIIGAIIALLIWIAATNRRRSGAVR